MRRRDFYKTSPRISSTASVPPKSAPREVHPPVVAPPAPDVAEAVAVPKPLPVVASKQRKQCPTCGDMIGFGYSVHVMACRGGKK